ncbi:MAG: ATP-binding cassette domain-containing protein [Gammaproteobacteria bacterium]|nr:ATP-binding cassette domain-containing protein [Gammaproteobacteria bacterium]
MSDLTVKNLDLSAILAGFRQIFDFSVPAGSCMGITGPSGIGKSVLLKALADMIPHKGKIFLGDVESQTISAPQWRRRVALLPADSQWWCETVGEHFQYFDNTLFSSLGFQEEVLDWQINHLSSGEKQRLACIRVLLNKPEALLLDEPTANLDKVNREKLELLIADYQSKHQVPVLWISHDNKQLARVSQYLLTMNTGKYEVRQTTATQAVGVEP